MTEVYNALIHTNRGADTQVFESGATLDLKTGSTVNMNSSPIDMTQLSGITAGTAAASKALVLDDNKDATGVRNLGLTKVTFAAGGTIDADTGTGACVSDAVTISKMAGVVTTEAKTTAADGNFTIVLTNTLIAAGDLVFITTCGGTNTVLDLVYSAVTTTNTATITVHNSDQNEALNGTVKFNFLLIKA